MPGSLINLAQSRVVLPDRIIVDSSLIIAHWRAASRPPLPHQARHAAQFFALLPASGTIGVMPAIVFQEVFHVALITQYRLALPAYREELRRARPGKRRFDWDDLFKVRPDLIVTFSTRLDRLRAALLAGGLVVLQPNDLGSLPARRTIDEALLHLVGRYQIDTSDAAILLDAGRAGIFSIATLDADLQQAQVDFDISTWREHAHELRSRRVITVPRRERSRSPNAPIRPLRRLPASPRDP